MDSSKFSNLPSTANYLRQVQSGKVNGSAVEREVNLFCRKSASVSTTEAKSVFANMWLIYAELAAFKPILSNKCFNSVVCLYKKITGKDATDIGIAELLWEYQKTNNEYNTTMLNYVLSLYKYNGQPMLDDVYRVLVGTAYKSCVPQGYCVSTLCDWQKKINV